MKIVSNAGPLINIVKTDLFCLLPKLYREINIPHAVYTEIVHTGAGRPGSSSVFRTPISDVVTLSVLEALSLKVPVVATKNNLIVIFIFFDRMYRIIRIYFNEEITRIF